MSRDSIRVPQSQCLFGVASCDITPPLNIYSRMWGAAKHDRACGLHQPLEAYALVFQPKDNNESEEIQVLVVLDHVLLWAREMEQLLESLAVQTDIAKEKIAVTFTHTHAAGLMGLERVHLPGGDLIPDYLDELASKTASIIRQAKEQLFCVTITYGTGQCDLARHRDYWDETSQQYVCGFNPEGDVDQTVLVARVTNEANDLIATVVNYACHPTTLAWDNQLISPDFPGTMRQVVARNTGSPCVFLQGASGDVGPRDGFVGDVGVAERNGRQLGYAALSILEGMPTAQRKYCYTGPVISGATIGVWQYQSLNANEMEEIRIWQARRWEVSISYREDLMTLVETREDLANWRVQEENARTAGDLSLAADCRAMAERRLRHLMKLEALPPAEKFPFPVRIWRIGNALWVALESELYNWFQVMLRNRFPDYAIVVITITNGSRPAYLPTKDSYGKGIYQETIALLEQGCLEQLFDSVCLEIEKLTNTK